MKFRISTLLFLTALVAVLVWGIVQAIYIGNLKSHMSVVIPLIGTDQIAFANISTNDAVIVVGEGTTAAVRMTMLSGELTETQFEEILAPGKYTLWLLPSTNAGADAKFGLAINGRSHFVNGPLHGDAGSVQEFVIGGNDSRQLLQAVDFKPESRMYSYRITLDALGQPPKRTASSVPIPP